MFQTQCRHFNGYKPCIKSDHCNEHCDFFQKISSRVLIIHLGALGAIIRSTSLLKPIKRLFQNCSITWVTEAPGDQLLKDHPLVDKVLTLSSGDLLELQALHFDIAFVIDKSLKACGILKLAKVEEVRGFICDEFSGGIIPATPAAEELWKMGLDNTLKFHINQKTEQELYIEALELGPYRRDEYLLPLSTSEKIESRRRKMKWKRNPAQPILGFNTGCSSTIPAKKWTVEYHQKLINTLLMKGFENIVLLGGKEDATRNHQIASGIENDLAPAGSGGGRFSKNFLADNKEVMITENSYDLIEGRLKIVESPTHLGLRDGLVSVEACDLIVSGDSLGMHMAIARKKWVIAWFGPTCEQEIDLYGRGVKFKSPVSCAPCWKRSCYKEKMCYDQISPEKVIEAIERFFLLYENSSDSNSIPWRSSTHHPLIEKN